MTLRLSSEPSMTILPASFEELLDAVGEASALKLIDAFGGTTQRLPAKRNVLASNHFAKIIGLDDLKLLVKKLGYARYVYIAQCANGLRDKRDREIVDKYNGGKPVEQLALEYKLSDRQIWNILKKTEMDDAQVSLF